MPQTSRYGGAIRFDPTLLGAGKPVDTSLVADCLHNNTAHFIDVASQPLVNWVATDSTKYRVPEDNVTSGASIIAIYGPLPLQLLPDGRCRVIVVALAGAADSGTPTITLYAALRPYRARGTVAVNPGGGVALIPDPSVTHVSNGLATFTTATATWSSTPILLRLTEDQVRVAKETPISTPHVAGGTVESNVTVALAQLEVWAKTSDATKTPRLFGVHAHEHTGTT